MTSVRVGAAIIGLWCVLNLLASLFVVLGPILVQGQPAPALIDGLTPEQISALDPSILINANGIAVFANGANVAFCTLVLIVLWCGLLKETQWAFWAISSALGLMLGAGVAADFAVGFRHPQVNLISAGILIVGLALAAHGLFKPDRKREAQRRET